MSGVGGDDDGGAGEKGTAVEAKETDLLLLLLLRTELGDSRFDSSEETTSLFPTRPESFLKTRRGPLLKPADKKILFFFLLLLLLFSSPVCCFFFSYLSFNSSLAATRSLTNLRASFETFDFCDNRRHNEPNC